MIFKIPTLRKLLFPLCIVVAPFVAAEDKELSVLDVNTQIDVSNLIVPASFETKIDSLMVSWYINRYTVKDKTRAGRKAPTLTDEEYTARLKALPTIIPMPYNDVVKSFIKLYLERRRDLVEGLVALSRYYEPTFNDIFDRMGLPMELRNLAIIESALNPNAKSSAGAVGLWQFMASTAIDEGLEVNTLVDERRDPYRSTETAAKYLSKLNKYYGDWFLAIAAYNCGAGTVNRAIRKAGGEKDYWLIYNYLPSETRTYVPAFIAANYVMAYYEDHNIVPSFEVKPVVTETIEVNKRVHFQQISDVLNIPMAELRALNPQYRADIIPGDIKPYTLTLPHMQCYSYLAYEDKIVNYDYAQYARKDVVRPGESSRVTVEEPKELIAEASPSESTSVIYHKIKQKDTVSSIAEKYGVTQEEVIRANGGSKGLKRGNTLSINVGGAGSTGNEVAKTPNPGGKDVAEAENNTQIVTDPKEQADNKPSTPAEEVSAAFNMSVQNQEKIEKKNENKDASAGKNTTKNTSAKNNNVGKNTANKNAGKANNKNNASTKKPEPKKYTVKKGDSLYKIAQANGVTLDELRKANPRSNNLQPGQVLTIPAKASTSTKKSGSSNKKASQSGKKNSNKKNTKKRK